MLNQLSFAECKGPINSTMHTTQGRQTLQYKNKMNSSYLITHKESTRVKMYPILAFDMLKWMKLNIILKRNTKLNCVPNCSTYSGMSGGCLISLNKDNSFFINSIASSSSSLPRRSYRIHKWYDSIRKGTQQGRSCHPMFLEHTHTCTWDSQC